jgi:hypothetical protein
MPNTAPTAEPTITLDPLILPSSSIPLAKIDVYMDDFITLTQGSLE